MYGSASRTEASPGKRLHKMPKIPGTYLWGIPFFSFLRYKTLTRCVTHWVTQELEEAMKTTLFPSVLFFALTALSGCDYYERKVVSPSTPPPVTQPGEPGPVVPEPPKLEAKYSSIHSFIFTPYCVRCHSGTSARAGLDLSSYEGAMTAVEPGDAENSVLFAQIDWEMMPPEGPLVAEEKKAIFDWIENGAKKD